MTFFADPTMKSFVGLIFFIAFVWSSFGEISQFSKKYKKPYDGSSPTEEQKIVKPLQQVGSVTPTYGVPWPLPQQISLGSANLTATPDQLKFSTTYQCDILAQAITRYQKLIFANNASGEDMRNYGASKHRRASPSSINGQTFTTLQIVIDQPCEKYPYLGMNENCMFNDYSSM